MSVAWVGAGIAAVSAVSGAKASSSAAKTQAASADAANQLQQQQYDQTREDNAPFRDAGLSAQNQLMMYLGLTPTSGSASAYTGSTSGGSTGYGSVDYGKAPDTYTPGQTDNPLWEKILGDWTAQHQAQYGSGMNRDWNADADAQRQKAALDAQYKAAFATDPQMQALQGQQQQQQAAVKADPRFGSLMKDFSMADFEADPGAQFRREQGEQGLTRAGAASGLLGSGKYLKDAMKFNSGLASQEYGAAFDRFQVNRANKLNPLQSLMGAGQTATNALGQAGANYASTVGNNLMGAGNARAAGTMGAANAVTGGMNTGWNMYQNQQYMNMLQPQTQKTVPNYPGAEY